MSVVVTTPINGRTDDLNELSFPAPRGKLNRLPVAFDWARGSCSDVETWHVVSWNDLDGD